MTALLASLTAERIGHYAESECDVFGELAPVTWRCICGGRLKLEHWVIQPEMGYHAYDGEWMEDGGYVAVSTETKARFLARHEPCAKVVTDLAAELVLQPYEVLYELNAWTITEAKAYYGGEYDTTHLH